MTQRAGLLALIVCLSASHTSGARGSAPPDLVVDLGGGQALAFAYIESLDLYIGKHEVTNGQFRAFRPAHDSGDYEGRSLNRDRQPAVRVSLEDARAFCRWLEDRASVPVGFRSRLPTGQEWAQLARNGDDRAFPWGSTWPPTFGNYADESAARALGWSKHKIPGYDDGCPVSCDVEQSGGNAWGLFGVGGNVWEWTEEPARDGSWRVLRGGSWRYNDQAQLRIDYRDKHGAPWGADNNVGFRVVLTR